MPQRVLEYSRLLDRLQNAQDHIADVLELIGAGGQGDDMTVRRGNAGGGAEGGVVYHLLQELLGQLELIDAAVGIGHLAIAVEDIARASTMTPANRCSL